MSAGEVVKALGNQEEHLKNMQSVTVAIEAMLIDTIR